MKTTFTLLLIIGLSIHAHAQHSNPFVKRTEKQTIEKSDLLKNGHIGFLPTSVTIDNWEDGDWEFNGFMSYEYDASNRIKQSIVKIYDLGTGSYVNGTKTNYNYVDDNNSNLVETTTYAYSNDDWVMVGGTRTLTEYDIFGFQSLSLQSYYQQGTGWVDTHGYKIERTYSGELLKTEIWYNMENGAWEPEDKTEWFYDSSNQPNLAHDYEYDDNDFILEGRYIDVSWYLWDGSIETGGYPLGYTYQKYNGSGDINNDANYTNDEKWEASYPEGNLNGIPILEETVEYAWKNNAWVKDYSSKRYTTPALAYHIESLYTLGILESEYKDTQTFDAFGNLIEDKEETHNGDENWVQEDGSQHVIKYEGSSSKMLERITKVWETFTGEYVNETRETFRYTATSINTEKMGVSVYPTIISSEINIVSSQEGMATFYSLTGSVVLQKQVYAGTNNVSTSSIPVGYYILKINGNTFKVVKK